MGVACLSRRFCIRTTAAIEKYIQLISQREREGVRERREREREREREGERERGRERERESFLLSCLSFSLTCVRC